MDLTINPVIAKKYHEIKNNAFKINPVKLDTLNLPFLDDFSKDNIYPDVSLWLDSNVFINRDYPIAPPTLGVATFDGVSKSGSPYDTLAGQTTSNPADTLTSKPVNLASLPSDSSVVLSFFWQAEGRGNDPEQYDSLLLQFRSQSNNTWNTVWAKSGYNPSPSDTTFKLVVIPITDTAYLKNAFQFRFRNYATISGNVDHWHIDYVLLDKNRNVGDTIFDDVAFVYNSRSLLINYYAMPWEQYQPTEMKTNLDFFIRNNDTASLGKNTSFKDTIFNSSGGVETSFNGGNANVLPYLPNGYSNITGFNNHPLSYSFPSLTKDTSFLLECVINTTPDKDRWNDTLRFTQTFNNYYAYDDGTAEGGYGLNYSTGQIAYKFTLNSSDILYAVYMLFNWIGPNVNQQQFKIRVWNDNGGMPGSVVYEDTIRTPDYWHVYHDDWGNLTNMFYPYILKTPQALSGTFYVGFIQYTNPASTLLNLGFDKNTNSNSKMFYDAGSGWAQSSLSGSWMIRPVFGDMDGLMTVRNEENITSSFTFYPNPSNGKFSVDAGQLRTGVMQIEIYNSIGNKVYSASVIRHPSPVIDISSNPNGIYFIRVTDERGIMHSQKLILVK